MGRCALLLGLALLSAVLRAQEPASAAPAEPIHTLRVFANLIQIPALVMDRDNRAVEERTHPKFSVTIDGGKPFAPAHVRLEGEDPLSLTVLMDSSGQDDELLREMHDALPALVPGSLAPRDHVSVYALDCKLVKTLEDTPADQLALKVGVEQALRAATLHGGQKLGACGKTLLLRDTLTLLVQQLGKLPGRRVLLVVTHGSDGGSAHKWDFLADYARQNGVSIFGVFTSRPRVVILGRSDLNAAPGFNPAFDALCQTSGGVVLPATETTLAARLADFVQLLRGRYIVQFPRPADLSPGPHVLGLQVAGHHYVILSAGAVVPTEDPNLKSDPTVVRGLDKPVDPE